MRHVGKTLLQDLSCLGCGDPACVLLFQHGQGALQAGHPLDHVSDGSRSRLRCGRRDRGRIRSVPGGARSGGELIHGLLQGADAAEERGEHDVDDALGVLGGADGRGVSLVFGQGGHGLLQIVQTLRTLLQGGHAPGQTIVCRGRLSGQLANALFQGADAAPQGRQQCVDPVLHVLKTHGGAGSRSACGRGIRLSLLNEIDQFNDLAFVAGAVCHGKSSSWRQYMAHAGLVPRRAA